MRIAGILLFLLLIAFIISKTKAEKVKPKSQYINPLDKFILARIIFAEAAGESHLGRIAVGCVIRNRVKSSRWPDTYKEVILQPHQFSGVGSFLWDRFIQNKLLTPEQRRIKLECFKIAEDIITGRQPDITGGATHYYNPRLASPSWAKKMKITRRIGNHIFLKEG